jgi:hypothetical protein
MFNLKKLKEVVGKEKHHVEASNSFAAFKDLDTEVEMNSAWETVKKEYKNFSQRESRSL